jgi:hypothetical protein
MLINTASRYAEKVNRGRESGELVTATIDCPAGLSVTVMNLGATIVSMHCLHDARSAMRDCNQGLARFKM